MLVIVSCLSIAQAQNNQTGKKIVVLYGYLYVFPETLGKFFPAPTSLISNLNNQKIYGYNDWRLPTLDELQLICANQEKINASQGDYLSSDGKTTVDFEDCSNHQYSNLSNVSPYVILVRTNR